METNALFRSIDELLRALDREKKLLQDMFERRKSLSYRSGYALVMVEYKRERIQYLIDHGVIHENGDFMELEDIYMQFFEEVLEMNEEINVSSVREYIESLKENINYFLEETNELRRVQYQGNVKKILRKIGLRTLKNVIDLKRNVDVAYKQEPNYKIKKQKLKSLDEKRKGIKLLTKETEKILADKLFFSLAADPDMQRITMDVRGDFTEADHNLLEIERQIIDYINQIDHQSARFKKIRRLKYLKDQLTWRQDTNIEQVLSLRNPLWMEPRPYNRALLSLDMLRSNEEVHGIIRRIAGKVDIRRLSRTEAPPTDEQMLREQTEPAMSINTTEMWHAFRAQGSDLFSFIRQYDYPMQQTLADNVILFCQMAAIYANDLRFTDHYNTFEHLEYELIYAG